MEKTMSVESDGLCLGLVGGLGVGAASYYYRELAKAHAERGAVLNLVMVHADTNRVLRHAAARETNLLAEYLSGMIGRMADAGARLAVIPAVTAHICEPRLREITPLPLVSLVEEIAREIGARKLKRVALFGTRFTVETGMFGRLREVEVSRPSAEEIDAIHAAYLEIVAAGIGTDGIRERLRRIAHRLCEEEGVETIILAGTELALLFQPENTYFPCMDGARLHLNAILRRILPEAG
jgi:aspartate racemase